MKLWKVRYTIEVVVAAEDYVSAWEYARDAARQDAWENDSGVAHVTPEPITQAAQLPDGWDDKCLPYGDGDGNTRIETFLNAPC